MADFAPTQRTQVRRLPKRGTYDRETVYRILDEGLVCNVGFVADDKPVVIPTGYGRKGDTLYLHGSPASRMFRALGQGADLCVTVTLIDGLVLARSAFHHSINYRSVVIFGKATKLEDQPQNARRYVCSRSTWSPAVGRRFAGQRKRVARYDRPGHSARRGVRQGPHRSAYRRRGGLRPSRLGRRPSP